MESLDQNSKSFLKRFWWLWLILVIGAIVLIFAAYNGYKNDQRLEKEKTSRFNQMEQNSNDQFAEVSLDSELPSCPKDTSALFTKSFMGLSTNALLFAKIN